jgi:hypothetical protein
MPDTPPSLISRHMAERVRQSLQDTPAVLVNGPRQCGKTTLAKQFAHGMQYITLDDATTLEVARLDPVGLVGKLDRAIIDEVQRAPQLLLALKHSIDEDRRPGRFLLACIARSRCATALAKNSQATHSPLVRPIGKTARPASSQRRNLIQASDLIYGEDTRVPSSSGVGTKAGTL